MFKRWIACLKDKWECERYNICYTHRVEREPADTQVPEVGLCGRKQKFAGRGWERRRLFNYTQYQSETTCVA